MYQKSNAYPDRVTNDSAENPQPVSVRRERTRDRLIDAAAQVFAHVGFGAASVEAIAEAAGFTRGAFYSNFASKEELFLALAARQTQERLAALEATLANLGVTVVKDEPLDRTVIRTVLASVARGGNRSSDWVLMQAELELLAMRDAAVGALWTAQQRRLQGEITAALTRLLAGVGLSFSVEPALAIELLLGAYDAAARDAHAAGTDMLPQALEALVDLLIVPA
jgi:AcrR family transcriptional regulator